MALQQDAMDFDDFEAAMDAVVPVKKAFTPEEALACSLENPEYCEACQ